MTKKILKGLVLTIAAVAVVILCLDSFGGYFLDGPLGPIPGGQMSGPVVDAAWPQVDEAALVSDSIDMVVQVNGKLRGKISVPTEAPKDAVEAAALANADVQRFVGDKDIRRVIVVPGKLVNVVV